ncbi:tRNA(Met) cytidine acetate ligase [Sporomusa rhizae]|uniref:nucleotidyltransferase n=1 Tax=Sporomusa rhizae TaxID=357999 RepID=UPI00352B9443
MIHAVGMIVEYNPFHNGHLWHLNEAKKKSGAAFSIGVMSGNFLQRGEPAMLDKWSRAAIAVKAGVDLIIELPVVFAVRSAQYFATGGVQLLNRLGIVSHLCFGAETPEIKKLSVVANALNQENTINAMLEKMKTGQTYAASIAAALSANCEIDAQLLQSPNNLLAIEYIRAIGAYAPQLIPLSIKRQTADYHDVAITSSIASATAVRTAIIENGTIVPNSAAWQTVPLNCAQQINELIHAGKGPVTLDSFNNIILAKMRTMDLNQLALLPDVTEGLHNKISSAALKATTAHELLFNVKSKRYTMTRLQRIIIHALLGTTKQKLTEFDRLGPLYARVLAFNDNGRMLLKEIHKKAAIPVITKTSHHLTSKQHHTNQLTPLQNMLAYDVTATDIFTLGFPNCAWRSGGLDYRFSPLYLPN